FPTPDPRYGEILAARQMPRDQWRDYHKWVRFYLHFCQKYHHPAADSKSLTFFIEKLASKRQTAEQQAQAHCAVDYYAVFSSPELRSVPYDAAVVPAVPNDGDDGIAPRTQDGGIGQSAMMEEQALFRVQPTGATE